MKTRQKFWNVLTLSMCVLLTTPFLTSCEDDEDDLVGNWVRTSDFSGVNRYGAASFVIGEAAYIVGGYTSSEAELLQDCWKFDVYSNQWIQMANFPGQGRVYAFGFTSNGKGYVGCGYNNKTFTKFKDVWEFDPNVGETGTWTQVEDFANNSISGCERYGCTSFTINGIGYVCGGNNSYYLNELWAYDASQALGSRWTRKSDLPKKRMNAQAFVIDNVAYVIGGNNNGTYPTDMYAFDPATNSWAKKREIYNATDDDFDNDYTGITREKGCTFVIDGRGYLTLGISSNLLATTWEYSPSDDKWTKKTAFEGSSREASVGFTVEGRGFIATGGSSGTSYDDVWEFQPNAEQLDSDNS